MFAETTVHIVALTSLVRAEQARGCFAIGYHAEIYGNYEELLAAAPRRGLVLAEDIPERGGIAQLMARMARCGFWLPVVAFSHVAEPRRVVEAVRAGALDYLAQPLAPGRLAETLAGARAEAETLGAAQREAFEARARLDRLTAREREVLDLLVAGASNKTIARELEISPRTVEIHRANMMGKLDARHAADAVRLRLAAGTGAGAISPRLRTGSA